MLDERTERLINRRLDGEITGQESLELDKLLIRNPEARAYLEDLQRQDVLAGRVLRATLDPDNAKSSPPLGPDAWPARTFSWRRYLRPVVAVAAAAALAFLVATFPTRRSQNDVTPPTLADNGPAAPTGPSTPVVPVADGYGWPPRERHEILGVFDEETQSLYLLEMNRPGDAAAHAVMRY
jgi:anti-sigma factor RsiW